MTIQSFACRIKGQDHEHIVNTTSPGKAKSSYYDHLAECCPDLKYTDIRVRRCGGVLTSDDFLRTATYRGVPFARIGMRVSVGGEFGRIVGNNSSANFNVLFDDDSRYGGEVLNCHPNWEITYYDDDGLVIEQYTESAA